MLHITESQGSDDIYPKCKFATSRPKACGYCWDNFMSLPPLLKRVTNTTQGMKLIIPMLFFAKVSRMLSTGHWFFTIFANGNFHHLAIHALSLVLQLFAVCPWKCLVEVARPNPESRPICIYNIMLQWSCQFMPVCGDKFLNLSPMQTVISLANDNTLTFFGGSPTKASSGTQTQSTRNDFLK